MADRNSTAPMADDPKLLRVLLLIGALILLLYGRHRARDIL